MRYCILASGSRGNSIFVESQQGRFLIDVGLSARQIESRLLSRDIDPDSIDAVLITHAHRDHVRGVGVFANRYDIPVIGHPTTLDDLTRLLKQNQKIQPQTQAFQFKDAVFTPFRVPHDSDPTVGFLVEARSRTLAICTDLGVVTDEVRRHVRQAQAVILESNHDPDMLMRGPYPWELKERIASRVGHLSNHNAGEFLREIVGRHLRQVVLGHLSEDNNTPDLAKDTAISYVGGAYRSLIEVVEQKTVSEMYHL